MNEKNLKENGILIRPFNLDDIDFVISGQLELYELEYGFKSDIWKSYVIDGVHDLVDQFDSKKDCMYILEHDGLPMGCAAITHVDDITAKFRFFFVDPKLRGKGAGHKLLDMSVKFCVEMDISMCIYGHLAHYMQQDIYMNA